MLLVLLCSSLCCLCCWCWYTAAAAAAAVQDADLRPPPFTQPADPTLNSHYAEHFVRGMQGNNSAFLKVSSALKHFAAYSQEKGRVNDPVVVSQIYN